MYSTDLTYIDHWPLLVQARIMHPKITNDFLSPIYPITGEHASDKTLFQVHKISLKTTKLQKLND